MVLWRVLINRDRSHSPADVCLALKRQKSGHAARSESCQAWSGAVHGIGHGSACEASAASHGVDVDDRLIAIGWRWHGRRPPMALGPTYASGSCYEMYYPPWRKSVGSVAPAESRWPIGGEQNGWKTVSARR